jgi:DNA polymerase III delta subunit
LTHIQNIEELDKNALSENLLASSFLSEKKMVIIDNIEKVEKDDSKKEFLMSILDKIPENNIIVFSSNSLQERSLLYKKIKELGEIKRFDIKNTYETRLFIEKKYKSKIDSNAIDKIIAYKSNNLSKIVNELDKLFITKDFVLSKDIIDYIVPEFEETIFIFVDKVLNKDKKAVFNDLDIILENIDIYAFYNSFL